MTTITKDATTITPTQVLGYQATTTAQNIIHRIVGSAAPDVTLVTDQSRSGTLTLLFGAADDDTAREAAWAAWEALLLPGSFDLEDPDFPELDMTAVRDGDMSITLDDNRHTWTLTVGYTEI